MKKKPVFIEIETLIMRLMQWSPLSGEGIFQCESSVARGEVALGTYFADY
jgi:hypothetical protein